MDYNVAGKTRILIKYSSRFMFAPLKTFLDAELAYLLDVFFGLNVGLNAKNLLRRLGTGLMQILAKKH